MAFAIFRSKVAPRRLEEDNKTVSSTSSAITVKRSNVTGSMVFDDTIINPGPRERLNEIIKGYDTAQVQALVEHLQENPPAGAFGNDGNDSRLGISTGEHDESFLVSEMNTSQECASLPSQTDDAKSIEVTRSANARSLTTSPTATISPTDDKDPENDSFCWDLLPAWCPGWNNEAQDS